MGSFPNIKNRRSAEKAAVNRGVLVNQLVAKYGFTISLAKSIVDLFVGSMADALANGKAVEFRGFGYFKLSNFKGAKFEKKIRFKTHPGMLERINAPATPAEEDAEVTGHA